MKNNSHINVAKLVVKGARDIQGCLQYAKEENKHRARAMLLLIKAAQTGDKALVLKLFGNHTPGLKQEEDYDDEGFREVQEVVQSQNNITIVPIEIARRMRKRQVREELLLRTDVNEEERYVHWHSLRLQEVEITWLSRITWVEKLRLARNALRSLPPDMGTYLRQVRTTLFVYCSLLHSMHEYEKNVHYKPYICIVFCHYCF